MGNQITCPSCRAEFEITEVMEAQLSAQIRAEVELEVAAKRHNVAEREKSLAQLEKSLVEQKNQIEQEVLNLVNSERKKISADARKQAEDDLRLQLDANETELKHLRENLKTAERNELDLRKRERELKERAETLELDVARQIDQQRDEIRTKAMTDADEQHRLKAAEKDKQIDDLLKKIDELKRRAEQGSQQLQGEVLELEIESILSDAFPNDVHEPTAKGRAGGDVLQHVHTTVGRACGSILWESKRTKTWQAAWLPKLRDDQRAAGAQCAILVSDVLPDAVKSFSQIDGVWVCGRAHILPLAMAIRAGMVELAKAREAADGRNEKSDLVYNYLCSSEFQHHVSALAEAFSEMMSDLDAEQRAMLKLWKKRRKQLDRAVIGTASLYGDLQGYMGNALPEIRHLALAEPSLSDEALT